MPVTKSCLFFLLGLSFILLFNFNCAAGFKLRPTNAVNAVTAIAPEERDHHHSSFLEKFACRFHNIANAVRLKNKYTRIQKGSSALNLICLFAAIVSAVFCSLAVNYFSALFFVLALVFSSGAMICGNKGVRKGHSLRAIGFVGLVIATVVGSIAGTYSLLLLLWGGFV